MGVVGGAGSGALALPVSDDASHRVHVSLRRHLGTFSKTSRTDPFASVARSQEMHLSANFHAVFGIDEAGFGAHAAPQEVPLKVRSRGPYT